MLLAFASLRGRTLSHSWTSIASFPFPAQLAVRFSPFLWLSFVEMIQWVPESPRAGIAFPAWSMTAPRRLLSFHCWTSCWTVQSPNPCLPHLSSASKFYSHTALFPHSSQATSAWGPISCRLCFFSTFHWSPNFSVFSDVQVRSSKERFGSSAGRFRSSFESSSFHTRNPSSPWPIWACISEDPWGLCRHLVIALFAQFAAPFLSHGLPAASWVRLTFRSKGDGIVHATLRSRRAVFQANLDADPAVLSILPWPCPSIG